MEAEGGGHDEDDRSSTSSSRQSITSDDLRSLYDTFVRPTSLRNVRLPDPRAITLTLTPHQSE